MQRLVKQNNTRLYRVFHRKLLSPPGIFARAEVGFRPRSK